jgi:hypothetical protein
MSAQNPMARAIDKMVQERTSSFWDAFTFLQVRPTLCASQHAHATGLAVALDDGKTLVLD